VDEVTKRKIYHGCLCRELNASHPDRSLVLVSLFPFRMFKPMPLKAIRIKTFSVIILSFVDPFQRELSSKGVLGLLILMIYISSLILGGRGGWLSCQHSKEFYFRNLKCWSLQIFSEFIENVFVRFVISSHKFCVPSREFHLRNCGWPCI
jgi:hypothetical protein